jgi:LPXTG-site transpeptidase (sortase) family protein
MLYRVEQCVWTLAGLLILGSASYGLMSCTGQEARLAAFDAAIAADLAASGPDAGTGGEAGRGRLGVAPPDRSDWSATRVRRFLALSAAHAAPPEAVLRIPALDIEAEIFGDTGERAHNHGVSHKYFRRLKDVQPGHRIHIVTRAGSWEYEVERTRIVAPSAVEVLAQKGQPALTLVTCYPFYFLGNAPERFIVHARMVSSATSPPTKRT